jgi:gliding motility-associated-like protein
MTRLTLILLLFIVPITALIAQTPATQWQKCFGGPGADISQSIEPTLDGGYILAGTINEAGGDVSGFHGAYPNGDLWVVKLDASGGIQWQRSYGGSQSEGQATIRQAPDGSYTVLGFCGSPVGDGDVTAMDRGSVGGLPTQNYWLLHLDNAGNILSQRKYGGGYDYPTNFHFTPDGGIIMSGYVGDRAGGDITFTYGNLDGWITKLDNTGAIEWQRVIGGSYLDQLNDVAVMPDGTYVATGYSASPELAGQHGGGDILAVKLDHDGNVLWLRCLGGKGEDDGLSVVVSPDGGCILAGYTKSIDGNVQGNHNFNGTADYWVVKVNDDGVVLWQRCYGGVGDDRLYSAVATNDGAYLLAGITGSSIVDGDVTCGDILTTGWVLKIGTNGDIQWDKSTGKGILYGSQSELHGIAPTTDGGFIAVGNTFTIDLPGFHVTPLPAQQLTDIYAVKLGPAPPRPTVSLAPPVGPLCEGAGITLTAVTTSPGRILRYAWLENGINVGNNYPAYYLGAFNNDRVAVQIWVAGECGDYPITSNEVTISTLSYAEPTIRIEADATQICAGTPVHFTATITDGGDAPTYHWSLNSQSVGSNTNQFTSSSLADGDKLNCQLTSSEVCLTHITFPSNQLTISVMQSTPLSVHIAGPAGVCAGDALRFTATAADPNGAVPAAGTLAYQWMVNGDPVGADGADGGSLSSRTLANGDVVSCTVTGQGTCVHPGTEKVAAAVYPLPIVGSVPPVTISRGQSIPLNLPVTGDIATYSWSPADGLSDVTTSDPLATPLKSVTYVLQVTSTDGCVASGSIMVKVFSQVAIPGAFSPNGDGHNDVFYVVGGPLGSTVKDFAVFDRWDRCVFQVHGVAPNDPAFGWDGWISGQTAPSGTYVYAIRMSFADGTQQVFKGTVVLVR